MAANRKTSAKRAKPVKRRPSGRRGPAGSVGMRRRPNPDQAPDADLEAAAALSESFHGRPARKVKEVREQILEPDTLADLGRLTELHIIRADGRGRLIEFGRGVRLAGVPEEIEGEIVCRQVEIVGGDQEVDLADFGLADFGKRQVILGTVAKVCYFTKKRFDRFESAEYEHEFGEESGEQPSLCYDTRNHLLYLAGGNYSIPTSAAAAVEGMSPGIVD